MAREPSHCRTCVRSTPYLTWVWRHSVRLCQSHRHVNAPWTRRSSGHWRYLLLSFFAEHPMQCFFSLSFHSVTVFKNNRVVPAKRIATVPSVFPVTLPAMSCSHLPYFCFVLCRNILSFFSKPTFRTFPIRWFLHHCKDQFQHPYKNIFNGRLSAMNANFSTVIFLANVVSDEIIGLMIILRHPLNSVEEAATGLLCESKVHR